LKVTNCWDPHKITQVRFSKLLCILWFTNYIYVQIRELMGPKLFAHYDSMLLSITLDTMSDITYCPRVACQCPVMRETDEKMGVCPSCRYVFCVYCKMTYHGVEPCRFKAGKLNCTFLSLFIFKYDESYWWFYFTF
jgi:hypothetical protein